MRRGKRCGKSSETGLVQGFDDLLCGINNILLIFLLVFLHFRQNSYIFAPAYRKG